MRKLIASLLLIVGIFLLLACTPKSAPTTSPVSIKPLPTSAGEMTWEARWADTLAAARKEGTLVVTTSAAGETRKVLMEGFKTAYGINLEVVVAPGSTAVPPIEAERKAGLYLRDIYLGGTGPTVQSMKPAGILQPLESTFILPELTDPETIKRTWYQGKLQWVDKDRTILASLLSPGVPLAINSNLVKEREISSWQDVLNSKWKGKIVMPNISLAGTGTNIVVWTDQVLGWDWLRQLIKNEPTVLQDYRLIMDWLARGKAALTLAPDPPLFVEFKQMGTPLESVTPKEGTWMTASHGGVSILNRAPHPNAAKVFVNWILSKEGQTILSRSLGAQSGREDVPADFLDTGQIRQAGVNYLNKEREDLLLARVEMQAKAKEIIAPLLK